MITEDGRVSIQMQQVAMYFNDLSLGTFSFPTDQESVTIDLNTVNFKKEEKPLLTF